MMMMKNGDGKRLGRQRRMGGDGSDGTTTAADTGAEEGGQRLGAALIPNKRRCQRQRHCSSQQQQPAPTTTAGGGADGGVGGGTTAQSVGAAGTAAPDMMAQDRHDAILRISKGKIKNLVKMQNQQQASSHNGIGSSAQPNEHCSVINGGGGRQVVESKKEMSDLIATDLYPHNLDNGWEHTQQFLDAIHQILLSYIREENDRSTKVLDFHQPEKMAQLIDLHIPTDPMKLDELLQSCCNVLQYGVRTGHPRFFNQLSCGLDIVAMAGEWLTATCNTNMFTYEVSPVFSLMEKEVTKRMIELIGWQEGGDAIFSPGGAIANMYALNAARHHHFPRAKPLGMTAGLPTLCCFTSVDSHYSIKSAAAVLGIGTDNCFNIDVDSQARMNPDALEECIIKCKDEGLHPFFVCATAGTTVYGAWDPIPQIADICKRYKLWLHVDAAWGGGLLLSPEHRHKLTGIEKADSVTWNPHKLMGAPLQCSACFVRQEGLLFETNQMSADYLFQQDKPYDVSYDTGDKAMQCGRHNDIFKLWLMWRSKGMEGYRRQINRLMDLAQYFTAKIKRTEGFEMVLEDPEYLNICFWYVPPSLRNEPDKKEKVARLEKVAPKIKARMMERGTTMVGYQPDKQLPNFFRMIISNPAIRESDLDFLIDEIVHLGKDL